MRASAHATAVAAYESGGKKGRRPTMPMVLLPEDTDLPEAVVKQITALEQEQLATLALLPDYVRKLVSSYQATVFGFEIFECIRKCAEALWLEPR